MQMPPSGELLANRYVLHDTLGQGAMGIVYRAWDRLEAHTVAVKRVMLRQQGAETDLLLDDSGEIRIALAREFELLSSLLHPHIVNVLNYGFDGLGNPFFVMTHIDGRNLRDAVQDQDTDRKAALIMQMLQALVYLHRRDLLHRDLKPDNVLVDDRNRVKLVDFGLAIEQSGAVGAAGSLRYMAPEIYLESLSSKASDLYAVGTMIYEIFAGRHPFRTGSLPELLADLVEVAPDLTPLPATLQPVVAKLLAKKPDERYHDAQQVIIDLSAALNVPAPTETIAVRESFLQAAKFVGREIELAQLSGALSSAIDGRGSSWLIGGESGVGKSRLLDELRTFGLVWGVQVVRGQVVQAGGLPYQCWRAPVRQLILSAPVSNLEAGILKKIVPDISRLLDRPVPDAPPLTGPDEQQRLVWTIADVFNRQPKPVMLILEDLHWANDSLEPLKFLNMQVDHLPLLIVGSYRDDETPNLPEKLAAMRALTLARLNDEEMAELSAAMLGEAGHQPQIIDLLRRETEGNVFFMVETLRALAEEAGQLDAVAAMTLPDRMFPEGIQTITQRRLAQLPLDYHPLLRIAAVAGRQLDTALLRQIDNVIDLDRWLRVTARAKIVTRLDGQWSFAHDKLRDGLLHGLAPDQLPKLHRMVAEAIEAVYPGDDHALDLLHHWHVAGNSEKEAHYALIGAVQEDRVGLFGEAYNLLMRALALLPESDTERRLRALAQLGETHWQLGNYDEAVQALTEARTLAQTVGDEAREAMILFWLGYSTIRYRSTAEALAEGRIYLETALDLAQIDCDPFTLSAINYGLGIHAMMNQDLDEAERYYHESLSIVEDAGTPTIFACYALNDLGAVSAYRNDLTAAERYFAQCRDLTRQMGSRDYVSAVGNLGEMARRRGDLDGAYWYYTEAAELANRTGKRAFLATQYVNMGLIELMRKNYDEAATHFRFGLQAGLDSQYGPDMIVSLMGMAGIRAALGDFQTALTWLGLAVNHPDYSILIQEDDEVIFAILREALTEEEIAAGLEQGKALDLEEVVRAVLAEIAQDDEE